MKKILIDFALERFRSELILKGRQADTIEYYNEFIPPFLDFAAVKYCSQLKYSTVESYTLHLRKKYDNPATVNTNLRAVRAFCYFCGRNNYTVPFAVNLVAEPKKIKAPYDEETVRQLVLNRELCKPAIAILMLIATAIRAKTLCNIRVEDIDPYSKTIILQKLKNNTQSVLPLPDYVCKRLKRYIKEFELKPSDYLLTTKRGEAYTTHSLYTLVTRYLKRKGYDSKGLHRFRHTFAKITAEQGISSILLSRWLTHSSVTQSEKYVNLYGTELRDSLKFNPVEKVLRNEKSGHD